MKRSKARSCVGHTLSMLVPALVLAAAGSLAVAQQASPTHQAAAPLPDAPVLQPGQPLDPDTVYLATGAVRTPLRLPSRDLHDAIVAAQPRDRSVIQLDGPMTPDRRAALEGAGIRIHDYIPSNAFIVQLDGADADAAAGLDFVQWHMAFQNEWKIAPTIGQRAFATAQRQQMKEDGRLAVIATLFEGEAPQDTVDAIFAEVDGAAVYYAEMVGSQGEISLSLAEADVAKLAEMPGVQFVEDAPELTFRNATTRWIAQTNVVNNSSVYGHGIHGEGQVVGVMDGRPDQNHCSLDGGKILFYNSPAGSDFHGTHTSCTAVGDDGSGNDSSNLRGIAWAANMVFDDVPSFTDTAMYNTLQQHHNQGARVHTNSWGDDGTTSYNSLCRGCDRYSHDFEEGLVMFAVTNQSLLKNPDNSKNILAVGASQDTPNQGSHCSGGAGPTSDGRRKPEIYLPGCNTQSASAGTACSPTGATGTSMACPAVTGACALIRQYYVDGYYPTGLPVGGNSLTPSGALIKATALNSTVNMTGVSGYPSNSEGWGRVLLEDSLYFDGDAGGLFVEDVRNANGLSTTDVVEHTVNVNSTSPRLKVTLVWTDPPASASTGSGPAWINDLDLEVVGPGGTYRGNFFSGGQSIAGGSADAMNNVEMVLLTAPSPGAYTVRIVASNVPQGPQGYALVVTGDIDLGPSPLTAQIVSSVPALHPLETPLTVEVDVTENDDTVVAIDLHYSDDNGGSYTTIPMASKATTYSADIPGFDECDDEPAFYVTVEGTLAGVITLPSGAPGSPLTFALGDDIVAFADDGESDQGWTVSGTAGAGQWERGVPVNGGRGDPALDYDGSGQCWLSQNDLGPLSDGNSDIDDGTTILTSAPFDTSDGGYTLFYAYWFNDIPNGLLNGDVFRVETATDAGGTNWVVQREYTTALDEWRTDSFAAPDSATLRIRVTATDEGTQNVVEAGLDAVKVNKTDCQDAPPPMCVGDLDGDDDTDVFDFGEFADNFGSTGLPPFTGGDMDGDGDVDVFDFPIFAGDFGCGL